MSKSHLIRNVLNLSCKCQEEALSVFQPTERVLYLNSQSETVIFVAF